MTYFENLEYFQKDSTQQTQLLTHMTVHKSDSPLVDVVTTQQPATRLSPVRFGPVWLKFPTLHPYFLFNTTLFLTYEYTIL